jgi:EAL domain-containing protein (putative c-di-GMP-specific phosphodiesterase class I)
MSTCELAVTASVGSAVTAHGDEAPAQLLHDADLAMYDTKHAKRQVRGSRPRRQQVELAHAQAGSGLAAALPGAMSRGELHLDYQPIVDAVDGRLTGVEALLRWTHPTRGLVMPALVIPLAEQSGRIVEIGEWVLKQAWADRRRWESDTLRDLAVSVNVSALQFLAAGFVDMVATVLLSGSIDPKLLTLEVTESVFISDSARASVAHQGLKEIGVMVALDDFGTGYSSLTHLLHYPVDTIKVDRSFVANLGRDRASRTIVAAVIDLGHGLGMNVVSEGVETGEQHGELTGLGCDSCQGFYFARPMAAASLEALISDQEAMGVPRLPIRAASFAT